MADKPQEPKDVLEFRRRLEERRVRDIQEGVSPGLQAPVVDHVQSARNQSYNAVMKACVDAAKAEMVKNPDFWMPTIAAVEAAAGSLFISAWSQLKDEPELMSRFRDACLVHIDMVRAVMASAAPDVTAAAFGWKITQAGQPILDPTGKPVTGRKE